VSFEATPTQVGFVKLGIFISSDAHGGAERYIDLLSHNLKSSSFGVVVIGRLENQALHDVDQLQLPVGPKWSRRTLLRSLIALKFERRLYLQAAATERVSIAHLQFKREQILLSKSLSREVPVIWTEHGLLPSGVYGAVVRFFYRRSSRYVKTILCVSQAVVEDLRLSGIADEKLRLAENPVDVQHFAPDASARVKTRVHLGLNEGEVCVLVMSRLDRHKGIDRVIAAMRHLPESYTLVVAGTGPAEPELHELGAAHGKRIRFLGFTDNPHDLLRAADVFCFASTAASGEGVPTMAVLEAMASGLPVVTTDDSGLGAWLPEGAGLIARAGDQSLADKLLEAYAKRESLGSSARECARGHDIELWKSKQQRHFLEALT
jgi:glycosyltransferase involved in cell wall biosynthesis